MEDVKVAIPDGGGGGIGGTVLLGGDFAAAVGCKLSMFAGAVSPRVSCAGVELTVNKAIIPSINIVLI
jgi:hypothetical protein